MKTKTFLLGLVTLSVTSMTFAAQSADYYKKQGINMSFRFYDKVAIIDNVLSGVFNQPVLELPSEVEYEGEVYTVKIIRNVRGSAPGCVCQKIIVPNTVTDIADRAFQHNQGVKEIVLPEGLTYLSNNMFSLATSLETLTIPGKCTKLGSNAFNGCENLKKLIIPASVTNLGYYTFTGCGVEEIDIKGNVTWIAEGNFTRCMRLKTINIPSSVQKIGKYAFAECPRLTFDTLRIPEGVPEIAEGTFRNCQCLTVVILPNSITTIGIEAFKGCVSLKSLTLGNNISAVSFDAFDGCKNLKDIYCTSPFAPTFTNPIEWHDSWYGPKELTIHIPAGCTKYWNRTKWNSFKLVEMDDVQLTITNDVKSTIEGYIGALEKKGAEDKNYALVAAACKVVYNKKLSSGNAQEVWDYVITMRTICAKSASFIQLMAKELKKAKTVEAQEEIITRYGVQ